LLSSLAYCAAASWLSLMTRRPVVIGIIYIILWEGSIATFAASAAKLSISAYGRAFVAHALPQAAKPVAGALPSATVLAVVVAVVRRRGRSVSTVGSRLKTQKVSGRPMIVRPISQAATLTMPVSHQPTSRYQSVRITSPGPRMLWSTEVVTGRTVALAATTA